MPVPVSLQVVFSVVVVLALFSYAQVAAHLARAGGKVRTSDLAFPELLLSGVLVTFFGLMMVLAFQRSGGGEEAAKIDAVIPSSLMFFGITAGIAVFLNYRGLRLRQIFGLNLISPLAVVGWSTGLILAAFPLAGAANWASLWALEDQFAPQPLVQLFSDVARQADYPSVAKIFLAGVMIAPVCEEFLFRGLFYGVGKRYLGALPSGLLCSLFFAAFHTNLPAFGGLFVLAVCLNLAYERTGSLLVPIGMHMLFNFTSLLFLYVQAQSALPA